MRSDRMWRGVALAVLLAPAVPHAQDRPAFPPTRDVAVTYRTTLPQPNTPQNLTPQTVLMRYSVAADRFRLDGTGANGGLPGYVLVEHQSRHATIVMAELGMMIDAPPRAGLEQAFILETGRRFDRRGSDTVAGLGCTVWEIAGEAGNGTACVTGDGVLLRASGQDRKGRTASIEATRVEYGRQTEALFFPPANVRKLDLAAGPGAAAVLDRLRQRQP